MTAYNSRYGGIQQDTGWPGADTHPGPACQEREKEIADFRSGRTLFRGSRRIPRCRRSCIPDAGLMSPSKNPADKPHARAERIWDREKAESIVAACEGKTATVEEKKKPSKQAPPLLYDLTSLQREANGRFGLSARRTLQLAQSLYERHKALTYPEPIPATCPKTMSAPRLGR